MSIAPFEGRQETSILRCDPWTGLIRYLETMRYREANSETKTLRINVALEWTDKQGYKIPLPASARWLDEGALWSEWTVEALVHKADVSEYVRASGP